MTDRGQPDEARLQRALTLAYRYLNRRDRTVHEMRQHLMQRDCREDELDGTIDVLQQQGYLDDARYACLFAEDKRALEQWGSGRIARTLRERGIASDLIERALAHEPDPHEPDADDRENELGRAVAVLERRFPVPPRTARERERAYGVLVRKGYESELAVEALRVYGDCAEGPPVLRCQ